MKLLKSKAGFTLIELLVVIGILAVLAAIAIPSVAGLIDRANVSADKTNANEMTNAIERFASEYELYCQDIASGALNTSNLDSTQGRVYNVTKATTRGDITLLESTGLNGKQINRDTKYPTNANTLEAVVQNYTKTSSSTFEPKQSDMHYWYNPDCGVVVFAEPDANSTPENIEKKLNSQIISGKDAKGNDLTGTANWINLTQEITDSNSNQTAITQIKTKKWTGLANIYSTFLWTDGTKMYYSENGNHYVLNGDTWEPKTWYGYTDFYGHYVFHNGTNTYICSGAKQYILDGDTWKPHQWDGYSYIYASSIGSVDGNYYYVNNNKQYRLNDNTWEEMPITNADWLLDSQMFWSDGVNLYYSLGIDQYKLNGNTWVEQNWNGPNDFMGSDVWTDGVNIYLSNETGHYTLNGNTWTPKQFENNVVFEGGTVWEYNSNYYVSWGTTQYQLN